MNTHVLVGASLRGGVPLMVDGGLDRENARDCIVHGASWLVGGAKCMFLPNIPLAEAARDFMHHVQRWGKGGI